MVSTQLVKLENATRMLAEIRTVDDAKKIINLAEAARVYAREVELGLEAQNHAAEIKLRAQRKAGQILEKMKESGERRDRGGDQKSKYHDDTLKLEDVGVSKLDAFRWQQIAAMPPNKFEAVIAEAKANELELTTAEMLRIAKGNGTPHVAQNSGENEWYTPPEYIEAARTVLGEIDLDPASTEIANRIVGAKQFYSKEDDGLSKVWCGTLWMNPPYALELVRQFASKFAYHVVNDDITAGIVLVNNATETEWFRKLVDCSTAILFTSGRVKFLDPQGNPGAPLQGQAIIYAGKQPNKFLDAFRKFGWGALLDKES